MDQLPKSSLIIERQPDAKTFTLVPADERFALPFVYSDPDFTSPPEPRSVESSFGQILTDFETGAPHNEYELSSFNRETLTLIVHYAVRGEMRSQIVAARERGWKALEALQPLKGLKIIDYGCGDTAKFVRALRSLGAEAYGIDSHPSSHSDIIPTSAINHDQHPELFGADIVTNVYVFGVADRTQQGSGSAAGAVMHDLLKPGGVVINYPQPRNDRDNPVLGMQQKDKTVKTFSGSVYEVDDTPSSWKYTIGRKV